MTVIPYDFHPSLGRPWPLSPAAYERLVRLLARFQQTARTRAWSGFWPKISGAERILVVAAVCAANGTFETPYPFDRHPEPYRAMADTLLAAPARLPPLPAEVRRELEAVAAEVKYAHVTIEEWRARLNGKAPEWLRRVEAIVPLDTILAAARTGRSVLNDKAVMDALSDDLANDLALAALELDWLANELSEHRWRGE